MESRPHAASPSVQHTLWLLGSGRHLVPACWFGQQILPAGVRQKPACVTGGQQGYQWEAAVDTNTSVKGQIDAIAFRGQAQYTPIKTYFRNTRGSTSWGLWAPCKGLGLQQAQRTIGVITMHSCSSCIYCDAQTAPARGDRLARLAAQLIIG